MKVSYSSTVIGQIGFAWVDGGPLYVRLLANLTTGCASQRIAPAREPMSTR